MKACIVAVCLLAAAVGAYAQDGAASYMKADSRITIQFDNRGSKVMSPAADKKIVTALAKHVFMVPPGNVVRSTGMGQSSLLNHQSVVTYTATGPTTNGKSPLANCQANIKSGWLTGSVAAKEIKKATDTWAPGDSVKLQSAKCGPIGAAAKPTGRKML